MEPLLYPLRFEPIYQYRLWGGRRLASLLTAPLPGDGPIGEAWVLSDRDDHQSRVADGPLKGQTISQLLAQFPVQVMGKLAGRFRRFPLLLKFLDAREMLSVQVHPADTQTDLLPAGETGKTEAWVVLEAGPKSRVYAGLKPGATEAGLRQALANGGAADHLAYFTPKPGCEDPRITFVEPIQRYMMTYTAFSSQGPRIALAQSADLFHWQRVGLATFGQYHGAEIGDVDDKDASLFPVAIPNPSGHPELAMLHRPLFPGTRPEEIARHPASRDVDLDRESIWISYCPMTLVASEPYHLGHFACHHRLATPVSPWERLKIGGGTPPIMTRHGWLIVYHGVSEVVESSNGGRHLCYSAGVMVLSKEHPRMIRYRSADPVLTPVLPQERHGAVPNVVFPTGIDRRNDLGSPDRFDVYYGMADNRIGVARLDLPDFLPPRGVADPPEGKV